tara:strand:- start:1985 stop:2362 length:378 start_codon:yes stop_codon:yes gene_type:complete
MKDSIDLEKERAAMDLSSCLLSEGYRMENKWIVEMLDEGLKSSFYDELPTTMLPSLYRYVVEGKRPGGFLTAVIENDLMAAVSRADASNLKALPVWAKFFYNCTPSECFGSVEKMREWCKAREEV